MVFISSTRHKMTTDGHFPCQLLDGLILSTRAVLDPDLHFAVCNQTFQKSTQRSVTPELQTPLHQLGDLYWTTALCVFWLSCRFWTCGELAMWECAE